MNRKEGDRKKITFFLLQQASVGCYQILRDANLGSTLPSYKITAFRDVFVMRFFTYLFIYH